MCLHALHACREVLRSGDGTTSDSNACGTEVWFHGTDDGTELGTVGTRASLTWYWWRSLRTSTRRSGRSSSA
eukprot:2949462-Rhodomonas_salina.1